MQLNKKEIIKGKILKMISEKKNSNRYFSFLRHLYKSKKYYLMLRSLLKSFSSKPNKVKNIYHTTIQKAGSQWIKSVFKDKRIKEHTGLASYPQHKYEFGEFHQQFPKYTFVSGLYIPYELYEEIDKPSRYKTFHVIRDPRNVVVSWYYSMLETHRPMDRVLKHRQRLKGMSFNEGISYCIKAQHLKFDFMRSWIYYGVDDPNVLIIKFEELVKSPYDGFKKIFEHCDITIPDNILKEVLKDYTKDKMRKRDSIKRKESDSHYRERGSNWREVFTEEHKKLFYDITGDLIDLLGYDK